MFGDAKESDFEEIEKLGEGSYGMGRSYGMVFKMKHKPTGKILAVKKMNSDCDSEDLQNEINMMKQFNHKNIVRYFNHFKSKDSGQTWILMECFEGSINDVVRINQNLLNERQISSILKDTLNGLVYLHKKKIIHRDVKAGNILMTKDGTAKLAHFGDSGELNSMGYRNSLIGTPYWMAPEVIQEIDYNQKADIWSLGITGIELAEGRTPLADIHPMRVIFRIAQDPPPTLSNPKKFSKEFNEFIKKCLIKKFEDRPSSEELLKDNFIVKAEDKKCIEPIVKAALKKIEEVGRSEALREKSDKESESSTDVSSLSSSEVSEGSLYSCETGTVVIKNSSEYDDSCDFEKKIKELIEKRDKKIEEINAKYQNHIVGEIMLQNKNLRKKVNDLDNMMIRLQGENDDLKREVQNLKREVQNLKKGGQKSVISP